MTQLRAACMKNLKAIASGVYRKGGGAMSPPPPLTPSPVLKIILRRHPYLKILDLANLFVPMPHERKN